MPAFIVFTRLRTRNPEEVKLYAEQAPKSLAGHTIKFLAQFGRFEVKEGGGVEGVAILEFRSFADAKAWYESPAYQNASQHRHKGEDYSVVIAEGVQPEMRYPPRAAESHRVDTQGAAMADRANFEQ